MKKTTKKILYGVIALAGLTTAGVKVASAMQKKQCAGDEKNPFEGKKVIFVKNEEDAENADGVKGHLQSVGKSDYAPSFYDKYVKRCFDIVLSFGGIVALSPLCWELLWQSRLMIQGLCFLRRSDWGRIRNTSVCISSAA